MGWCLFFVDRRPSTVNRRPSTVNRRKLNFQFSILAKESVERVAAAARNGQKYIYARKDNVQFGLSKGLPREE